MRLVFAATVFALTIFAIQAPPAKADTVAAQQTNSCISISEEDAQNPLNRYGAYLVWAVTNNCPVPYSVSFCSEVNGSPRFGRCGIGDDTPGIFVRSGSRSVPGYILPGQSIEYPHAIDRLDSAYSICVARQVAPNRYVPGPTCPKTSAGIHAAWAAPSLQSRGWRVSPDYPAASGVWTR